MSDVLGINYWRERTKDGWRIRYGVRGVGPTCQKFYNWLGKRNTVDHSDDWPWDYFSFADPADDEALKAEFAAHIHELEDDDSDYVEPIPLSEIELELSRILYEAIASEIRKETRGKS